MGARVVTVSEILDGHAALDVECLDRVYLNAYVPILQSSGQVVAFMTQYLDLPIPSPALFEKIGQKFRRSVASFAEANHIPWVKFAKDARKAEVMAPYLKQAAAAGRSQVAAIGVAQEFQRVWTAYQRDTKTAAPQYTFTKADRRVLDGAEDSDGSGVTGAFRVLMFQGDHRQGGGRSSSAAGCRRAKALPVISWLSFREGRG
jgi:hypothetical protein